jgi:hypothetical protein
MWLITNIQNSRVTLLMDTYTRFLTLENVRNFLLYVIENDLFCNEFFIGFFMDLYNYSYYESTPYMRSCLGKCNACLNDVPHVTMHCYFLPAYIVDVFVCLPLSLGFQIEQRPCVHNFLETWKNSGTQCGMCITQNVCCHDHIRAKIAYIDYDAHKFLSIVQTTLLKPKHQRVLLNYPPYVEYTITSSIFGNMLCCNARRQYAIFTPQNLSVPISYNENAFFDFILSPAHQMQILSHAMTYGMTCCVFCKQIDIRWSSILSMTMKYHSHTNATNYVRFTCDGGQTQQYRINNLVFYNMIGVTYGYDVNPQDLHTVLCKMCAYRDFVTFYPRMKCILPLLHEMIYNEFDQKCVANHVFGNEYVVKQIFNFL